MKKIILMSCCIVNSLLAMEQPPQESKPFAELDKFIPIVKTDDFVSNLTELLAYQKKHSPYSHIPQISLNPLKCALRSLSTLHFSHNTGNHCVTNHNTDWASLWGAVDCTKVYCAVIAHAITTAHIKQQIVDLIQQHDALNAEDNIPLKDIAMGWGPFFEVSSVIIQEDSVLSRMDTLCKLSTREDLQNNLREALKNLTLQDDKHSTAQSPAKICDITELYAALIAYAIGDSSFRAFLNKEKERNDEDTISYQCEALTLHQRHASM